MLLFIIFYIIVLNITPPTTGSLSEKRRFATFKTDSDLLAGMMAMGFIVMWINFIPLYGPALSPMDITSNVYPHIFVVTHICGLLCGSYYLACKNEIKLYEKINHLLPATLALLTITLIIDTGINKRLVLIIIFLCMGLLSGWIVSRWMAWFSSSLTAGRRGSVFGKSLTITYIFISVSTFVLTNCTNGIIYALIISASIVMFGGYLARSLPITGKQKQPLARKELLKIIPPIPLILFALFGYSVIALTYRLITSWGLKEPVLPWLLIVPYALIGLLLGPYSDRAGRYIFFILAFLCTGLGFVVLIVTTDQPVLQILTGLLINSGLLFVHLYYWLSLADYQDSRFAPLSMAVGVSIELAIFSITYAIVSFATDKPDPSFINIGLIGIAIILIGFAIITGLSVRSYSRLNSFEKENMLITSGFVAETKNINPAIEAYFITAMGRDKYVDAVIKNYHLTKKEAEIAYMLSTGYSNQDINIELHITINTLKYHLKNIYSKLSVTNRKEAKKKLYSIAALNTKH